MDPVEQAESGLPAPSPVVIPATPKLGARELEGLGAAHMVQDRRRGEFSKVQVLQIQCPGREGRFLSCVWRGLSQAVQSLACSVFLRVQAWHSQVEGVAGLVPPQAPQVASWPEFSRVHWPHDQVWSKPEVLSSELVTGFVCPGGLVSS